LQRTGRLECKYGRSKGLADLVLATDV
jgi:hypothetical protein